MTGVEDEKIAEEIVRIRLSQLLINEEYKAGKFKIPVHLALGHEAIAVAVSHALLDGDKLILSHRNMAYNLARLGALKPILDEYLLKPTGLANGKLGSMNLINPERNIIYSSSILGNNFPVAVGIAVAERITERNGVTCVLGGDGAIEEGSFYESLTMMKTLGVNSVVIMENNEWSLGTHISERRCPIDLEKLAGSIGIPYLKLEGNHAHRYVEVLRSAREESLRGNSPVCVEVSVKTLGDRKADDGRYINYHAGPAPTVDASRVVLRENEDDPVFVVKQEIGEEEFKKMSGTIMEDLRNEIR